MSMTDQQLDALIDEQKPHLRIALRSVLEGQAVHLFNIGSLPLANGQHWNVVCTILAEPLAHLIEGLVGEGFRKMSQSYAKLQGTKLGDLLQMKTDARQ